MSLSDWNIAKAIVFVDIPKLILWRKIDSSPKKTFIKTISGPIVSVSDAVGGPPESLVANIDLTQEGSGDPSPDNVRPITGWTGASVCVTGANIWGGTALRDDILEIVPSSAAESDEGGDYVRFLAPNASTRRLFNHFKPNTQYTIILSQKNSGDTAFSNLRIYYTDGTYSGITKPTAIRDKEIYAVVSTAGKSVSDIRGLNQSGTTYLYYNECGVFEGALTVDDYVAYAGTTYPVSWESEAGAVYSGNITLNSDGSADIYCDKQYCVLDGNSVIGDDDYYAATDSTRMGCIFASVLPFAAPNVANQTGLIANWAVRETTAGKPREKNVSHWSVRSGNSGSSKDLYLYAPYGMEVTESELLEMLTDNPLQVVIPIATPRTYHIDAEDVPNITLFQGKNTIWADTGDVELTYEAESE